MTTLDALCFLPLFDQLLYYYLVNDFDLTKHASYVGLIYDQTLPERVPMCAFWQVDKDTIVTTAHSVVLYRELFSALKARFPTSGQERSIRSIVFHPELDLKELTERAQKSLSVPYAALPLQLNNICVMKLTDKAFDASEDTVGDVAASFAKYIPPYDSGLTGSLADLELPMVVQTITNARKEGTLSILDERKRTIAQLYCTGGRVKNVAYRGMVNESAFYQIVNHRLNGTFHFTTQEEPYWVGSEDIQRQTDMLLIESHRRLDELDKLSAIVGGPSSLFERTVPEPNYEALPPDIRGQVKTLWPFIDGGTPLGCLWQLCGMDDYAIYQVLQELIKTRQISYFEAPFVKEGDKKAIRLGLDIPLSPNDTCVSLWVEDGSMAPLMRKGTLLGSSSEKHANHIVHTIGLPVEAAGCPVFKDGGVIGLHCGAIPPDPSLKQDGSLQQMIWVESVLQCLRSAGESDLVKRLTLSGLETVKVQSVTAGGTSRVPGIKEVVRIQCPKCGRSSMELANFCKGCGQRLIEDLDPKEKKLKRKSRSSTSQPQQARPPVIIQQARPKQPVLAAVLTGLVTTGLCVGAAFAMPKPNQIEYFHLLAPETPRIAVAMEEVVKKGNGVITWQTIRNPNNLKFEGDQTFLADVDIVEPCYTYCLYQGESGKIGLMYPTEPGKDQMLDKGYSFSVGSTPCTDKNNKEFSAFTFTNSAGTERLLFMACGQRAKLLTDQGLLEEFVRRAIDLVDADEYEGGIETTVSALGKKYFAEPEQANSKIGLSALMGDSVYLKLMQIRHEEAEKKPVY